MLRAYLQITYPGKYHKVKGEVLHYSKCSYFNVFFIKRYLSISIKGELLKINKTTSPFYLPLGKLQNHSTS